MAIELLQEEEAEEEEKEREEKQGKTFLGIIFTFGALLLVYCLVFTY